MFLRLPPHTRKTTRGPLNHLLKWFKPDINALEKIPTTVRDPTKIGKIPLKVSIAENREDSIKETENATETVQNFSDGSALEGKVGVLAVLFNKGEHTQTLHYHLGLDSQHMVHKAKMVGLLLGLHLLTVRKSQAKAAIISIDNQAVIKALELDLRSLGHHLHQEKWKILF